MKSLPMLSAVLSLGLGAVAAAPAHAEDLSAKHVQRVVDVAIAIAQDEKQASEDNESAARRMDGHGIECNDAVDKALKRGAAPTTPIVGGDFNGTLATAKQELCSRGWAAYDGYYAKKFPEHKALLKNDKWRLFLETQANGYFINGYAGERNSDPDELAKAKLWFEQASFEPEGNCRHSSWVYYRYQFDKNGKLVKESKKSYCGDPGGKAMR